MHFWVGRRRSIQVFDILTIFYSTLVKLSLTKHCRHSNGSSAITFKCHEDSIKAVASETSHLVVKSCSEVIKIWFCEQKSMIKKDLEWKNDQTNWIILDYFDFVYIEW